MDTQGRIITFNSSSSTFVNVYPKSGTDVESRREREQMFTTTLPNMLVHRKENIIIGGDWNAIINNIDATHYPEAKHSPSLKRLIGMLKVKDCHRVIYGKEQHFSRFYKKDTSQGATRLDRIYINDSLFVKKSEYKPISFSDH